MSDFAFVVGDRDWTELAACDGMETELFFATSGSRLSTARAVCESCPVRIPCLVDALERGEEWGVWGGMTPEERSALLGRRSA